MWTAWIKPDRNDDPQTEQCNRHKQSGSPPGLSINDSCTSDAMIRPLHETKMGNVLHSALHDSFSPSTDILSITFPSDFDTFGTQEKILFKRTTGA